MTPRDGGLEVTVGRMIEYTEDERRQLFQLAAQLTYNLENPGSRFQHGPASLVLAMYRLTRQAVLRSHATE